MSGLGEVCTHIAAVLFFLEASTRLQDKVTCTQEQCQWIIPSYQKEIPYAPVKDLDFTSAKGKKQKIDSGLNQVMTSSATNSQRRKSVADVCPPSGTEIDQFYKALSGCGTKPAVLSVTLPFAYDFQPKTTLTNFPQPLPELFKDKYLVMDYVTLLDACSTVDIALSADMAEAVEKATRDQASSCLWYRYRAGRITSSKMKASCRTSPESPAQSLIKTICYPEAYRFRSEATSWGCNHEKSARNEYERYMVGRHAEFEVVSSGLVINPAWAHIGASPDGVVICKCCSKGVLEVKCPFCHRNDASMHDIAAEDKHFCLKQNSDGSLSLDHSHAYYYQVQTQMFVCEVDYCDFVVCTFPADSKPVLHIERIKAEY